MALRVYDTLTGSKREFAPVTPGKVGMYVCGMTVQDKPHVGHIRSSLAGEVMRRYFEHVGYRVTYGGRSICYVTDNELYDPGSDFYSEEYVERLVGFARDADVLITDCTYTDDVYPRKVGWGHSSVSQVADLAARALPKTLYLIHHDPDDTDDIIDSKFATARERLAARGSSTTVVVPAERSEVDV